MSNKFQHNVAMLYYNRAFLLDIASHMTTFNQLDWFISAKHSYTNLNIVYDIVPCLFLFIFLFSNFSGNCYQWNCTYVKEVSVPKLWYSILPRAREGVANFLQNFFSVGFCWRDPVKDAHPEAI